MSDMIYLRQRYQKELESIEQAGCAHARRAHQELARLYSIRMDMLMQMAAHKAKLDAAQITEVKVG